MAREMENTDLGLCGSPASVEGPERELPLGGGCPTLCTDESRDGKRCEVEASPGTTAVLTGSEANPIEQSPDEFDVIQMHASPSIGERIEQHMESLCSSPRNGNAASTDLENSTGASVAVWNQGECDSENGLSVEEDKGRFNSLEGDPDIGTLNKGLAEESNSLCHSPPSIMVECELQNSLHIFAGIGGFAHLEGDEGCKESEVAFVRAESSTTVGGLEGGISDCDRDKGCNQCEFAIVRQSLLKTDCSSELGDGIYCKFLPQDNKVTSFNSRTKGINEMCGTWNSSELVPSVTNKDDSEVAVMPCVVSNCLEQALEKPSMDVSVEEIGGKEADAPTHSEERDTHISTCLDEMETVAHVHFENESCQASSTDRKPCDLVQGFPGIVASGCTSEEIASLRPAHPSNASEDCLSCLHSVLGDKGDTAPVDVSSTCCGSADECCTQADSGGKADLKSGTVPVIRRRNPKRMASSRNNQCITKSDPPTRSRSAAKKGRHAVNFSALLSLGNFTRVTKKRCHSWKRARISVWGELGNLLELFNRDDELSHSKNRGSRKGRYCGEGRRQLRDRRAISTHRPRVKCTISTNRVILPGKMDRQLTLSANSHSSIHTDSNDCSPISDLLTIQELSKAVNAVENISEIGGCSLHLSRDFRNMENQVTCHEQLAQHGDKDPESSVTQEASVENTVSDCHGIQSQVGQGSLLEVGDERLLLDAGTSPDSGVLHPNVDAGNITNEGATSTSHEPSSKVEIMGQNIFDSESPVQENLHAGVLIFSQVPSSVPRQNTQQRTYDKKAKRSGKAKGKKSGKVEENGCLSSDNSFEGTSQAPSSLLMAEKPSRSRTRQRKKDGSCCRIITNRKSTAKVSEDIQKCDRSPAQHSFSGTTGLACCQGFLMSKKCSEGHAQSAMGSGTSGIKPMIPENPSSTSINKGQKPDGKKPRTRKSKLTESSSAKHRRHNVDSQKKDNSKNSMSRRKAKQKMICDQVTIEEIQVHDAFHAEQGGLSHLFPGTKRSLILSKPDEPDEVNILQSEQHTDVDESNSGDKRASKYALSSLTASINDDLAMKGSSHGLEAQAFPKRSAWVRCDDCFKWRSIAVELADIIDETNCRWTCKDNSDKAFADCMIPQEKTNAQINAELEISDASCEEDSFTEPNRKGSEMKPAAAQRASWVLVKSNIFLHRTRKTQTIDEIMVCQCKPPLDGSLGCGDECLNRMLNIECIPGTCPCGNLCSNQQFQKRNYAKFKWFRCGKKGFGLQLLEDASQGEFLIEYVGEVLDLIAYETRQREYASRGQKHFYFMTLNGNEVIDACAKGNLGRFINHSCEPNCRTEKWMVNGEVCIGVFAIRDIKKGEEVTFDYNYVRVFGAAAKRCVCGSAECRGYIGGDPLNTETIVQGDSDEEYPEPVMILEDGLTERNLDEIIPESTDATELLHEVSIQSAEKASKTPVVGPKVDEFASQDDDASLRSSSDGQLSETSSLISKSYTATDPILDDIKCIHNTGDSSPKIPGSPTHTKSSCLSSVKKKHCSSSKSVIQKWKKTSATPLTQPTVCRTAHFEGVEEKLNELLDAQAGISKRRDATKGYLKLLLLTASSGDNVKGEASQSTRDLSLILDVILKTKSRTVLGDIINKNGLQMLHNIMKQKRKNFNKIPILRKLLKVLEYLAVKEILTPEHINNIPSHAGVESFKESIINLTHHNDIQVHQMARNFRDKWLPRTIRKAHLSDRENGRLNSKRANSNWFLSSPFKRSHIQGVRDTNAICVSRSDFFPSPSPHTDAPSEIRSFCSELASTSTPSVTMNSPAVAKLRKRKSRWDQPSDAPCLNSQISSIEEHAAESSSKIMRFTATQTESDPQCTCKSEEEANCSSDGGAISNYRMTLQGIEEVPPGFGPPANNSQPPIQSGTSMICGEVVAGHHQERYRPQLTVSYGIPLALAEQLGTVDAEARHNRDHQSWAIAPGMPFHPFPPLPPLPRGETSPASSCGTKVVESREETRPTDSAPKHLGSSTTNLSVERASMAPKKGSMNQQPPEKMNWSSGGFGKKFFRPDRWNDHRYEKFGPPWPRERTCCKFRGNMRNGMPSVAVGSIQKMGRGSCFSEGVRGENVSSSSFTELPHQVQ